MNIQCKGDYVLAFFFCFSPLCPPITQQFFRVHTACENFLSSPLSVPLPVPFLYHTSFVTLILNFKVINLIISLYIIYLTFHLPLPIVFCYTCNLSVLQLFSCYSFIISSPFPCPQGYGGSWIKGTDYILEMISPLF